MRFIFTGTGTSQGIPVIGCKCEVCTSSDSRDKRLRTSGILQSDNSQLVFDAGPDFRSQMLRADMEYLDAVVFTHQHKDHTAGLDDVRPFIFRQGKPMDVYAPAEVIEQLKQEYAYAFSENPYPGAPAFNIHEVHSYQTFQIGDIELKPIPVMHGNMRVLGFRAGNFAYVTDTNFIPHASMEQLKGLDILVLDALRIEKHHSHFSLREAIEVAESLEAKKTYFIHLSHLMGKHETASRKLTSNLEIAYDGLVLEW